MGAVFTALGQLQEGRIAEAQGRFAQQIAIRNQQVLERQAKAERAAAEVEEARIARAEKIVKAQQRAIIGKSGIGLAGATLSLLADTAFQFSFERNLALRRGLIRGRELGERGRIELARGEFAFTLGKEAKRLSFIKAGGSILSGVQAGEFSFLRPTPSAGTVLASQATTGAAGIKAGFFTSPISRQSIIT